MELDILGLATLHRIASRFGDGLKPELLAFFEAPPKVDQRSNIIDGAAMFLAQRAPRTPAGPVTILADHRRAGGVRS
ncbi:MAG: hypothetical protein KTR21_13545 [Rhodobacteraceae bacterium]|nr:hypothetical protein [Paracoccaceae bacterium]